MFGTRYWKWQAFKLAYVLGVIFVLPALLIGTFALYLAIYEPEQLRKNLRSKPQVAVDPLESPTYFVRQDALKKLAAGPPDRSRRDVAEKLVKLLHDSNPQVHEAAIDALGDWGQPADAGALGQLASDRFAVFVRPRICTALAKIGGEESVAELIGIVGMGGADREEALHALTGIKDVEGLLLTYAGRGDKSKFASIFAALERIGTGASKPLLESAKQDADREIAAQATKALEAIKGR